MTVRARGVVAAAVALGVAGAPAVAGKDDFGEAAVVFGRERSLWKTDPKGKGPAVEIVALPDEAARVRMIRSDAAGEVVLIDVAGTWWWARLVDGEVVAPEQLPCADAPARLTVDGRCVVCADEHGNALLIGLVTGRVVRTKLPAEGARIVIGDGKRELVWADGDGVWAAPLAKLSDRHEVAPEPPRRGFVAAPDGARGVAIYDGTVFEKKQRVAAEVLAGFALDGTAARRTLHRDGVVVDWSWDAQWVLVQAGAEACVTRAVGGQYKCWKGYDAVSIAPDGRWVLLLGRRAGADADTDGDPSPESEQTPPRSLYRGRLEGAYTERPSLVETVIDAPAALWLP